MFKNKFLLVALLSATYASVKATELVSYYKPAAYDQVGYYYGDSNNQLAAYDEQKFSDEQIRSTLMYVKTLTNKLCKRALNISQKRMLKYLNNRLNLVENVKEKVNSVLETGMDKMELGQALYAQWYKRCTSFYKKAKVSNDRRALAIKMVKIIELEVAMFYLAYC